MNPQAVALQARTRAFANKVIKLCEALPATPAANSIREQLLDSSGSTDSNYRAACRARTRKEFISKLGVVVEESDESLGWLQLLIDSSICTTDGIESLRDEANELVAIFVQSEKTAKHNYELELGSEESRPSAAGSASSLTIVNRQSQIDNLNRKSTIRKSAIANPKSAISRPWCASPGARLS